jgi:DNA-binding NtrC family response regulator
MKVESRPGAGTTFRVLLPASDNQAHPDPLAAKAAPWRSSGRVLVVDDEDTVRTITSRILEGLGFVVILAADGREAVKKFEADPAICLVLLDLTMPHMDGEETFREITRLRPGTKVLLMSGFNEHEAMSRFVGSGLAGFVQKPFNVTQLTAHVREVLG